MKNKEEIIKSIFKLMIERIDINSKTPLDVHIVLH